MFTNWVCNKFFDGDYDKSEFNTTVRAYLTIAEISAMAGTVATYGYYTLVSLVKALENCWEKKIITKINDLYDKNAKNYGLQVNYLRTAESEISILNFIGRTFLRFTAKRANDALQRIRTQAVSSAKLYLTDLGVDVPDNDDAILNLASKKVKLKQRIFGQWPQHQMEHQVAFKVDAVQNEV